MGKDDALNSAIEKLRISAINVRESRTFMADDFNILNFSQIKKKLQTSRSIQKIESLEVINSDDSNDLKFFYIFQYAVGARLVKEKAIQEKNIDQLGNEDIVLILEIVFDAVYSSKNKVEKIELEAFADKNVGFNVWPYWREFVQSSCSRMGIKPINVPLYIFKKESDLTLKVDDSKKENQLLNNE